MATPESDGSAALLLDASEPRGIASDCAWPSRDGCDPLLPGPVAAARHAGTRVGSQPGSGSPNLLTR